MSIRDFKKRMLAWMLAIVMMVGVMPAAVVADGIGGGNSPQSAGTVPLATPSDLGAVAFGAHGVIDLGYAGLASPGPGDDGYGFWSLAGDMLNVYAGASLTITGGTEASPVDRRVQVWGDFTADITIENLHLSYLNSNISTIRVFGGAILNLTVEGTNTLIGSGSNAAGIEVSAIGGNSTLNISGVGTLTARGGPGAAGIGSFGFMQPAGNINMLPSFSGTINAYGGNSGSGIGGGDGGGAGNITIGGGTVNATGAGGASAIGPGGGSGGSVNITGGAVNATHR